MRSTLVGTESVPGLSREPSVNRCVAGKTVTRYLNQDQLDRYQSWFDNAR